MRIEFGVSPPAAVPEDNAGSRQAEMRRSGATPMALLDRTRNPAAQIKRTAFQKYGHPACRKTHLRVDQFGEVYQTRSAIHTVRCVAIRRIPGGTGPSKAFWRSKANSALAPSFPRPSYKWAHRSLRVRQIHPGEVMRLCNTSVPYYHNICQPAPNLDLLSRVEPQLCRAKLDIFQVQRHSLKIRLYHGSI